MKTASPARPTLHTLTTQFLDEGRYVRNWSLQTLRTYGQNLTRFRECFSTEDVDHLPSKTDLQSFIIWMRSKGFTPGGCNVRIRAVNSFLSWAHEQGITPEHMKLKLLRAERKAITTLSDAEIRRLVTFRPKTYTDRRAWTITVLLLDTGLRIEEIPTLERQNVDLEHLLLKVLGKGSKERLVPISVEGH